MRTLRDLGIRPKVTIVVMVTSLAALLAACLAFVLYDRIAFQREMVTDRVTLAEFVGRNSTAALTFADEASARDILSALQAERNVVAACIYNREGRPFATYVRQAGQSFVPPVAENDLERFTDDSLEVFRSVRLDGRVIGTVFIESDLQELDARLTRYGSIVLFVMLGSSLLALGLSSRLQAVISGPILDLVRVARLVTDKEDYSVRAVKHTADELGTLIDGFNAMLAAIHQRDRALHQSEEHFRSLIEHASDVITIWDEQGLIRYGSPSVRRLLGYAPEEFIGRRAVDFVHPDDAPLVDEGAAGWRRGSRQVVEFRWRRRDGEWVVLEAVGSPVSVEGGPNSLVVNCRDVTERNAAEQEIRAARDAAEEANRAKSRFLASMSHELRTPLGVIIGYAELLQEQAADEQHEDLIKDLKTIQQSGQHLLALINDILDLSKIEAGRMQIEIEEFSLATLLEDVSTEAMPLALKNGNRLQVNADPSLGTMTSDRRKTHQSLLNLMGNACKFTQDGRVSVGVTREQRDGCGWVVFTVSDTGIGMTEAQVQNLFQDFVQAHLSTTGGYGGSGLGLAISRRYCRMLGGDISVVSRVGQGSTFSMALPEKLEISAAPAGPAGPTPVPAPGEDHLAGAARPKRPTSGAGVSPA